MSAGGEQRGAAGAQQQDPMATRVWLVTYQEALRAGYATPELSDPVQFAFDQARAAMVLLRKSRRGGGQ